MNGNNINCTKAITEKILAEISKVVIGQEEIVEQLAAALLSGGHVLLEGVPGVAKTLAARTLAKTIQADFRRVQFTPDLMPADITGTKVFDSQTGSFNLKKGPVFTDVLLADEINRTPPKTQSALLEAMEEKAVTIDGETNPLSEIFMVVATQNPLEYEGTYPLPEAQLDRFMVKLLVGYIPQEQENKVLDRYNKGFSAMKLDKADVNAVCSFDNIFRCRDEIASVEVEYGIMNYITSIVTATRNSPALMMGASPRASIALLLMSKTWAAMQGRAFVTPEDVKDLALPVLRHRIILKPEASLDGVTGDDIIRSILNKVEVPR